MNPYPYLEEPSGSHRPRALPSPSPSRKPVGFYLLPFAFSPRGGLRSDSRREPQQSPARPFAFASRGGGGRRRGPGPRPPCGSSRETRDESVGIHLLLPLPDCSGLEINYRAMIAASPPDCRGEPSAVMRAPGVPPWVTYPRHCLPTDGCQPVRKKETFTLFHVPFRIGVRQQQLLQVYSCPHTVRTGPKHRHHPDKRLPSFSSCPTLSPV